MAKYSYEFKKEIVMTYTDFKGGMGYLAKKYGVKSPTNVIKWVRAYKEFGDDGLMRSRKNKNYSFGFKLSVVELYLTTEVSFQSMSRKGNCLDNSVMENFFGILKQEIYYSYTYYSFNELKSAIENYVDYYGMAITTASQQLLFS